MSRLPESWLILGLVRLIHTYVSSGNSAYHEDATALATDRLRQHAVMELGLGFLPILLFLGLLFLTLSIGLTGSCLIRI